MKIIELTSKIKIPITNEEAEILEKFKDTTEIAKKDLDQREQIQMNQLVQKDIVYRKIENGKVIYRKKVRPQND